MMSKPLRKDPSEQGHSQHYLGYLRLPDRQLARQVLKPGVSLDVYFEALDLSNNEQVRWHGEVLGDMFEDNVDPTYDIVLLLSRKEDDDRELTDSTSALAEYSAENATTIYIKARDSDKTTRRIVKTLSDFLSKDDPKSMSLKETIQARNIVDYGPNHLFDDLSEAQESEIARLRSQLTPSQRTGHDYIRNIQTLCADVKGPPGTGKTFFGITEAQILRKANKKVLMISPTNACVDSLAKRYDKLCPEDKIIRLHSLITEDRIVHKTKTPTTELEAAAVERERALLANLPLLRVGKRTAFHLSLCERSLNNAGYERRDSGEMGLKENPPSEWQEFRDLFATLATANEEQLKRLDELWSTLKAATLGECSILAATCSGALENALISGINFDAIIADQSAFATEMGILAPVLARVEHLKLAIFVGDASQLRPVVTSHNMPSMIGGGNYRANPMSQQLKYSFLQRMHDAGVKSILLKEQYRMVHGLATNSSSVFYKNQIVNGAATELVARPAAQAILKFLKEKYPDHAGQVPHLFINVPDGVCMTDPGVSSRKNIQNTVHVINFILAALTKVPNLKPEDIVILTAYKAQRDLYAATLRKLDKIVSHRLAKICLSTIDAFQGNENSIAILDTVTSMHRFGAIGFMPDPRRLNVGITRGRNAFIMVGDMNVLGSDVYGPRNVDDIGPDDEYDQAWLDITAMRKVYTFYQESRCIVTTDTESTLEQIRDAVSSTQDIIDLKPAFKYLERINDAKKKKLESMVCNRCRQTGHYQNDCPNSRSKDPKSIICGKCGSTGHKGSECSKVICHRCKQEGHKVEECPMPRDMSIL